MDVGEHQDARRSIIGEIREMVYSAQMECEAVNASFKAAASASKQLRRMVFTCCSSDEAEVAEILLEAGVPGEFVDPRSKLSPLVDCLIKPQCDSPEWVRVVRLLVKSGARLDHRLLTRSAPNNITSLSPPANISLAALASYNSAALLPLTVAFREASEEQLPRALGQDYLMGLLLNMMYARYKHPGDLDPQADYNLAEAIRVLCRKSYHEEERTGTGTPVIKSISANRLEKKTGLRPLHMAAMAGFRECCLALIADCGARPLERCFIKNHIVPGHMRLPTDPQDWMHGVRWDTVGENAPPATIVHPSFWNPYHLAAWLEPINLNGSTAAELWAMGPRSFETFIEIEAMLKVILSTGMAGDSSPGSEGNDSRLLLHACRGQNPSVMNVLLYQERDGKGKFSHEVDDLGKNPLHWCMLWPRELQLHHSSGLSIKMMPFKGRNAAEVLEEFGIRADARDVYGRTPVHMMALNPLALRSLSLVSSYRLQTSRSEHPGHEDKLDWRMGDGLGRAPVHYMFRACHTAQLLENTPVPQEDYLARDSHGKNCLHHFIMGSAPHISPLAATGTQRGEGRAMVRELSASLIVALHKCPDRHDNKGCTRLHVAAKCDSGLMVRALLIAESRWGPRGYASEAMSATFRLGEELSAALDQMDPIRIFMDSPSVTDAGVISAWLLLCSPAERTPSPQTDGGSTALHLAAARGNASATNGLVNMERSLTYNMRRIAYHTIPESIHFLPSARVDVARDPRRNSPDFAQNFPSLRDSGSSLRGSSDSGEYEPVAPRYYVEAHRLLSSQPSLYRMQDARGQLALDLALASGSELTYSEIYYSDPETSGHPSE